ncbi:ABC transporter permease [Bacillaceae bacterium IKA-2]|jgi:peptide/nickel transport system permease protein|nr:ABC transporter permease [Bacillaceae bacterium IKA-2]
MGNNDLQYKQTTEIMAPEIIGDTNRGPNVWKKILSNKGAVFGISIIIITLIIAIFAPFFATHGYAVMELPQMLKAPSLQNFFGTDEFGRDIFSRVVYGAQVSLLVGFGAVGITMIIGITLGALAGYYGGIIDHIITGLTDIAWSFPAVILAIAFVAVLGPSLPTVIIVVALVSWGGFTRIVRAQFLTLREQEFIDATRVLGMSDMRIIFKHLLPNSLAPIIVLTTMEVPKAIIIEASLSFLGLGVQPPTPSWGSIMSAGRSYIVEAPWIILFPGLALALFVLGFNLFGDALRDILDPRLKKE